MEKSIAMIDKEFIMHKRKGKSGISTMHVPKSILIKTLKSAISTGEEDSINDFAELLYANMQLHSFHEERIAENKQMIESQHRDIVYAINTMKDGFERMDKRFEQVDKRFEQVDKRFEQVDKRFEQVDKRFEQVEARFNRITAVITAGFAMITVLMAVFKFISIS